MLKNFKYERPHVEPREEPHPITTFNIYGEITAETDSPWISHSLENFHDLVTYHMSCITKALESGDPDEITRCRNDFFEMGSMFLEDSEQNIRNLEAISMEPATVLKENLADAYLSEVRNLLRQMRTSKERHQAIEKDLANNSTLWLRAASSAPDVDGLVDREWLREQSRLHAIKVNPSLGTALADADTLYKTKRKRLAEINATVVKTLEASKIDPDTVTDLEHHYRCFKPLSDREKYIANRRIKNKARVDSRR